MSKQLMHDVWTKVPLDGYRLLVLVAIAEAANELGSTYKPMHELAAGARMTRQCFQRRVQYLRDHRWIVAHRMLGQGGTLVYQLNLPKINRSIRTEP